jgi:hypothetical protein
VVSPISRGILAVGNAQAVVLTIISPADVVWHDGDLYAPVLRTSHDIEPAVALALIGGCCLRDHLSFGMGHMHREHDWFIVCIEPERRVIGMGWLVWRIITLPDGFDLSIDPGAVTRTVVYPSDQSLAARGVGCAGDLPVGFELLA